MKTITNKIKAGLIGTALCLGLSLPAYAADTKGFSADQTKEIEQIIYDYFMENPEVIFEATSKYRDRAEQQKRNAFEKNFENNLDQIFNDGAPFTGNPEGDITIVEFFDYNCGYCHKALNDVLKLLEEDKNIKLVFKDLPILSQSSADAARWALAAGRQGRYFEFHKQLMSRSGAKSEKAMIKIAEDLGLDVKKLKKDADSKAVKDQIAANLTLSRKLGISGTPAFIIGDILAPGYMGVDNMKLAIEEYRKNSKDKK